MFDTVKFRLTGDKVEGVNFLDEVTPLLDPVRETNEFDTSRGNSRWASGKLGNLYVEIKPYELRIKGGSLCKWMLGDNYQTMKRGDVKDAIEKLSDTLHVPMDKATITRLDVGMSIPVNNPPARYLKYLGDLKYAERTPVKTNTLYYDLHSETEQLCFYDKNKEQRANHNAIPDRYRGCNVLRYEQRYKARLPRLLKVKEVTGAMLYDERFYVSLLNRWRETYQAIRKTGEMEIDFDGVQTPREYLLSELIDSAGGETEAVEKIDSARKCGKLTRVNAYRLKQAVRKECEDGMTPSKEIEELNDKIDEAVKFNLEQ